MTPQNSAPGIIILSYAAVSYLNAIFLFTTYAFKVAAAAAVLYASRGSGATFLFK